MEENGDLRLQADNIRHEEIKEEEELPRGQVHEALILPRIAQSVIIGDSMPQIDMSSRGSFVAPAIPDQKPAPNTEKKRLPVIKRSSIVPASSIADTPRRRRDRIVNIPSEEHVLTERTLHASSIRNSAANNQKYARRAPLGISSSGAKRSLKSFKTVQRSNQENAELSERGSGQVCPNTEKITKRKALGAVARNNFVDSRHIYSSKKVEPE